MKIRLLTTDADLALYDAWVRGHPQGTLWQSLAWKRYQEALGRTARVYGAFEDSRMIASALVVIDRTSFGLSTWDIPRGPLGEAGMELVKHIKREATQDRCLSLFYSPTTPLSLPGASRSARHEQPEATRMVDIAQSEEQILAQMHQKGRYNIKVAEKNGVTVQKSTDIEAYIALAKETAQRDGFTGASAMTYQTFLEKLKNAFLLLAYESTNQRVHKSTDRPIAGLLGVTYDDTCIYYYGASSYDHRSLMAPYLLQWEAMKHGKAAGCTHYDLLGIAPPDAPADHPWQGISGFKEKFGGSVVTYPSEQQLTLRPWTQRLLQWKRRVIG